MLNEKNFLSILTVVVVISALVGGVFGYYGATLSDNGTPISQFLRSAPVPGGSSKTDSGTPVTSDETAVINVVKKSTPAVVSIVATKDLAIVEQKGFSPFQDFCHDPFFRQFLGNQCSQPSAPPSQRTQRQQVAAGTGFVISSEGLILTNKHVINISGANFTVITNDGKKYAATILAKDPVQDLAVLKISATGLPTLPLGDSSTLQIGQTVIAIGNALGQFSNTVSRGVISGLSRSIVASDSGGSSERLDQIIQTDAAINPGNSGGPLLNLQGQVVGIDMAVAENAQNIGFAIPINQAKKDIDQVKSSGKIVYPFLGIRYALITSDIKEKNNLPVNYGAIVVRGESQTDLAVTPGSPADKAGIKENDIILEIDGVKITPDNDLAKIVQNHKVGDSITLKILSQGREKNIQLTLEERK